MALATLSFYFKLMEINEVIEAFVSEAKERLESVVVDNELDNGIVLEIEDDESYALVILMEMVESFAGEYSLEISLTPEYEGNVQLYKVEFVQV